MATRSKPMVFFEKPTGISRPCSQTKPREAQPPGPGRYSGNIFGSTSQIQYGIPWSSSAPIEPYLNRSSGEPSANCWGSSRKNVHHPTPTASTTRTASPVRSQRRRSRRRLVASLSAIPILPGHAVSPRRVPGLEGLQVLDDRVLVLGGQADPVEVAAPAVARQLGIELEEGPPVLGGDVVDEADLALIEDVVAPVEDPRPPLDRLQEVAQRRHRPVVEVGGAGPDPVQGLVGVALGLAEVGEA